MEKLEEMFAWEYAGGIRQEHIESNEDLGRSLNRTEGRGKEKEGSVALRTQQNRKL